MNDFQKLKVWNEGINLVSEVYTLTKKFPKEELFGLTSQVRRCSVSIPSNIAEGAGRNGSNEFIHFLGIANGSCCELVTQIIIAERMRFIAPEESKSILEKLNRIQGMNVNLIKKLKLQSN